MIPPHPKRPPERALVYALYCGRLYGTERMALATLDAMRSQYTPLIAAPPGPIHAEAARLGISTVGIMRPMDLIGTVRNLFDSAEDVAVCTASLPHAVAAELGAIGRRSRLAHIHVVHGGMDERTSYGKKKWVAKLRCPIVAVSHYVRERLIAHGVPSQSIFVCPNFLSDDRIGALNGIRRLPRRKPLRILSVGRLEPQKAQRVLLEAAAAGADSGVELRFVGDGTDRPGLEELARQRRLNATFTGFIPETLNEYADADLFVHTAAEEPFGLVVLEAMAAGLTVVTPDRGGTAEIVEHGLNGFRYRAGDAADLARTLASVIRTAPETRAAIGRAAAATVRNSYSPNRGRRDYATILAAAAARRNGDAA